MGMSAKYITTGVDTGEVKSGFNVGELFDRPTYPVAILRRKDSLKGGNKKELPSDRLRLA